MNKIKASTFLPFLLLLFTALGCSTFSSVESTQIPQDEIKQQYSVRASKNETHAAATFTRGSWGASVDLDGPSRVENNGAAMAQRNNLIFAGVYYGRDYSGVEKSHTFTYTNNNGKKFVNSVSFEPVELVDSTIEISRVSETRVALSRPLGDKESMRITVTSASAPKMTNDSNSKTKKTPVPNTPVYELTLNDELDSSRAAIVLKPKNFNKFALGKATLKIEVSREFELQQSTPAGGSIGWTYESVSDATVR